MEPTFIDLIEKGHKYSMFDIMDAESKRAENAIYIKKIFTEFNALIGPTLPVLPFSSSRNVPEGFAENDLFSWLPFTYPFNLTKNPASNINIGFSNKGLPVGLQIVADIYEDKKCFCLASFIEKEISIIDKWPNF